MRTKWMLKKVRVKESISWCSFKVKYFKNKGKIQSQEMYCGVVRLNEAFVVNVLTLFSLRHM